MQNADDPTAYLDHVYSYEFDPQDRLSSVTKRDASDSSIVSSESYTHDANANVIKQTINGTTTSFTYDRNRLLTTSSGGVSASYNYDPFGRLNSVVGALLTTATGLLLIEVALGRLVWGFVALAPSGVYQRSWSMEGFYPWDESVGVRASQRQEPVIELLFPSGSSVRVQSLSRVWRDMRYAPNLVVRARWLTVDPALVLAAMDFYQKRPEHRPELSGAAGVERIRQHQFS